MQAGAARSIMHKYKTPLTPVPGPEAFEETSPSGRHSQAAFLLATSGAVGGFTDLVDPTDELPMPQLTKLRSAKLLTARQAMKHLDADQVELMDTPELEITAKDVAPLAKQVMDSPEPARAASLVEGGAGASGSPALSLSGRARIQDPPKGPQVEHRGDHPRNVREPDGMVEARRRFL